MSKGIVERDSFVCYRSFFEATRELPAEAFKEAWEAIMDYALNGVEPTCTGVAKIIFIMAKPNLMANNKRYVDGLSGGRPRKESKPETSDEEVKNQDKTKAETKKTTGYDNAKPNVDVNDNVNENVNVNDNKKQSACAQKYPYQDVVDYLNRKVGTNYKHTSPVTRKYIKQLCDAGYTLEDFKTVIDKKYQEWKGTKFENCLRPTTLFGENFESYLNQTGRTAYANPEKFVNFQSRNYDFSEMENALLSAQG